MRTREIERLMKKDCVIQQQYGDVCAADQLPMTIRYRPRLYIVNTDPRSKPGHHWTAFYFPRRGPAEFFDPIGHSPDHYNKRFKRALLKNARHYKYNKIRVQDIGTMTCGQFCLFYAYYRCRGFSMKRILNLLSDPLENERIVTLFVQHM